MTKEQRKEYSRQYYLANREKLLARNAAYRRDNPEKVQASVTTCHGRIAAMREELRRLTEQRHRLQDSIRKAEEILSRGIRMKYKRLPRVTSHIVARH